MIPAPWRRPAARMLGAAGLLDFQAYLTSNPDFAAAWSKVDAQLAAEGADTTGIQGAQISFVQAFSDLSQSRPDLLGTQVGDAAEKFTLIQHTAAGALSTVQGLVNAVESGAPIQIAAAFTGTLVTLAIAVGAVSAGVGAAIIGAVGAILSLLGSLTAKAVPSGQQLMPGCYTGPNSPAFNINYVMFLADSPTSAQVDPTSSSWRRFPTPTEHPGWFWLPHDYCNPSDPTCNAIYSDSYPGGKFTACLSTDAGNPANNWRMIDLAWPQYRYLECAVAQSNATDFQRAFFAAWKAAKEYALNGLTAQPDYVVLVHLMRLWNKAHERGTGVVLMPQAQLTPLFQGPCPGNLAPYEPYLVADALLHLDANDPLRNSGGLLLHTGPPVQPSTIPVQLHGGGGVAAKKPAVPISTPVKLAAGAALAAAGVGVYAHVTHQAYGTAWRTLYDETLGRLFAAAKDAWGELPSLPGGGSAPIDTPPAPVLDTSDTRVWGPVVGPFDDALSPTFQGAEEKRRSLKVESLLFDRDHWTPAEARKWAVGHGYRHAKVHLTERHIRIRQFSPRHGSTYVTKRFGDGISAVLVR